ncbi:hypothetical protein BS78_05G257000 [Paspalum vaginatum]|nr:hypothetical protein BS78_05G257000 [Paspalum vaginatum]
MVLSDMCRGGVRANVMTLCSLVSVCASPDHVALGSGVHSLCVRSGLHSSVMVANALVNMYSSAGELDEAESLFWNMSRRDAISWNTMISSYVQNDRNAEALETLGQLLQSDEGPPNHMIFSSTLGACSSPEALMDGRTVHAMLLQRSLQNDLLVCNSLLTMYSKCNSVEDAERIFQSMPCWRVVMLLVAMCLLGVMQHLRMLLMQCMCFLG